MMSFGVSSQSSRTAGKRRGRRSSGSGAKVNSFSQCEPTREQLVAASASLCHDQLKPYGRLLRKRLGELAEAAGVEAPDAELPRLRQLCSACMQLHVRQEGGADWAATVLDLPVRFIDIYSPHDYYGEEFWLIFSNYLENLHDGEMEYPGGRYVCAQGLMSCNLPFMTGFSLGQVNHIVQLAMTSRKVLGYCNGAIVPYSRSQTLVKQLCAEQGCQLLKKSKQHPVATWGMLRNCIWQILQDTCDSGKECFPLSNVKRVLTGDYKLDLSETALGHVSLSDLFQDSRLQDLCTIRLFENGYYIYPSTVPFFPQSYPSVHGISLPSECIHSVLPVEQTSISLSCASHRVPQADQGSVWWLAPQELHLCPSGPSTSESRPIFSTPFVNSLACPSKTTVDMSLEELSIEEHGSVNHSGASTCGSIPSDATSVGSFEDVSSLPSTPRAMVAATPTPFLQRHSNFAEQLRVAVGLCDEDASSEDFQDGSMSDGSDLVLPSSKLAVRNTFIHFPSSSPFPGLRAGALQHAQSVPASPFHASAHFSQLLSEAVMQAYTDDDGDDDHVSKPFFDLPSICQCQDELCRSETLFDSTKAATCDARAFTVKNTFIDIASQFPEFPIGSQTRPQSLPATPFLLSGGCFAKDLIAACDHDEGKSIC